MSREQTPLSSEVRSLLDREREIPVLSPVIRARALARARAALAAGPPARRAASAPRRGMGWVAAAALILLASGTVAAAYGLRDRLFLAPSPTAKVARSRASAPALPVAEVADGAVDLSALEGAGPPTRGAPEHRLSRAEAMRAELRLLRHARAAVVREDFAAALPPISEHARRFKDGRLAEEREALRVKALVGLGRAEEARRAATAFEARFPRSVLLPAITQMSPSRR